LILVRGESNVGRVQDKVVLITGAARGQGRSHAVRLAEEGADVILFDICGDIETNDYPLASPEDLAEAKLEVEKTGRRAVAAEVDVRDRAALAAALATAVGDLGGTLDVVVANAGICPLGKSKSVNAFADAFDVDFVGVVNTVHAALPYLKEGASIITIGSIAGLIAATNPDTGPLGPGGAGYNFSKQMVDAYTKQIAAQLAAQSIRANVIHPTNCNTAMLHSDPMYRIFRPDLAEPTREDALLAFPALQAMPVPYIEPEDVSNVVCYLASDESRYVTGSQFKIDAGAMLKH
jgi:SDR family mycofactocin-dependent oxidoreductase